jgi:hypothetical protein
LSDGSIGVPDSRRGTEEAKSDGVCFVRVPWGPGHGIERLHRTVIVPGSEEGLTRRFERVNPLCEMATRGLERQVRRAVACKRRQTANVFFQTFTNHGTQGHASNHQRPGCSSSCC